MIFNPHPEQLQLWSIEKPQLPKRSHLYHLPPVGVGTPFVESLTSYIARLAESHSVLPSVLISKEITPYLKKVFAKRLSSRRLRALFDRARALNGTGEIAMDFVQALETLTLRSDLCFLTLHSCASILAPRGLFRPYKAWCPACYQKWRLSRQVVYEPLLWVIETIKVCPQHQQPLCLYCPHCHKQPPLLEWHSRSGYCSICGKWLGSVCDSFACSNLSPEDLKKEIWVADSIGELITAVHSLSSPLLRENVAKAMCAAINLATKGNIAAFASDLGIPKNTLWMWHTGKALPQLDVLLKICYWLEISLLDFLIPEKLAAKPLKISLQKSSERAHNKRVSPKPFDSDTVEEALQAMLASDEKPPLTMKEAAERLNHDRRTISRHFPNLCHAIAAKSRRYRKAAHEKKIEQSCEEVRQIALKLHNENVYPSEGRVSQLMTKPGDLRNKKVRATLQELQSELSR
ncbi:helix-turn-helix domain-containing protein [Coleofasciculus sp. FACHB-129]|uniref:helix-turn-helix domain-containing protein n=1 Tax=Cyanophyceae TaxID=3028117 RepID=UPI0016822CDE|nr:helix-turn-helix domain-containing protein [Coleofasciculus sp. FACHB-129]MBD1897924.1 helix-turn-helix domain-containing protein [Coleofasciculus sp. FACHB-129]